MKTLITLSLFILTACGKDPSTGSAQRGVNPFAGQPSSSPGATPTVPYIAPTPKCSIPIVGVFQNTSDGITATIAERGDGCGVILSCGFKGYIFDQGGNQYLMIASTTEGDTTGGCAFPAQSTNYSGKSGPFYVLTFGNYAGIGWQGGFLPTQTNNQWSKLQ